ncbi:MAG: DUF1566 domain-containing protein, partial [Deltaproteobacteria bacterium]|nr:DUF1566 domain-containing protein [Deltaproteobacteria bacterium]
HQADFDIPGTFSLDVVGSRYSDAEGAHAQGDVLATFESMGFSNSYTSNTAFNCLLSWNGGSVDTTDGHFFVTVPIPNRPLLIDPASTKPIDIALRFPLTQSFAWQDLQNANFTEGVFDVSSIPGASEMPSRLPICDFFMADRCAEEAMPERVAPAFPMPDSSSVYCSDGTSTLPSCPAPGEPAFGQDGNYPDPPTYTVDTNTVVDAGTQLVWQRGLANEQLDWWHARDYCATLELGGRADWTLPSRNELISIIDAGRQTPSIDLDAFPNSPAGFFWTASPVPFLSLAYGIRFDQGYVYDHDPVSQGYVRCVTQVEDPVLPRYRVVGSLVEDLATGLFWQQTMGGDHITWTAALAACEDLALDGHDDFRLPDIKELQTLVDETRIDPCIDVAAFPGTLGEWAWSSTPSADYPRMAWAVSFTDGYSTPAAVSETYQFRCLR